MSATRAGSVNTTWKYGTGNSSAWRSVSHCLAAAPWHFGQCRLRQGDSRIGAVLTARDMAAERRGAAALDRRHHLEVAEADMAGIGTAPCRAMVAEDIRNLQRRARHARRASGGRLVLLDLADEMIERAGGVADRSGGNLRVARRRVELGMSEQHLDHANIDVLLQ